MTYLWIIAVPVTAICVLAIVAHAAFMRAMMPPLIPDMSQLNRHAPDPFKTQMRNPQEALWERGNLQP